MSFLEIIHSGVEKLKEGNGTAIVKQLYQVKPHEKQSNKSLDDLEEI
jgi:hypothetical protein